MLNNKRSKKKQTKHQNFHQVKLSFLSLYLECIQPKVGCFQAKFSMQMVIIYISCQIHLDLRFDHEFSQCVCVYAPLNKIKKKRCFLFRWQRILLHLFLSNLKIATDDILWLCENLNFHVISIIMMETRRSAECIRSKFRAIWWPGKCSIAYTFNRVRK